MHSLHLADKLIGLKQNLYNLTFLFRFILCRVLVGCVAIALNFLCEKKCVGKYLSFLVTGLHS